MIIRNVIRESNKMGSISTLKETQHDKKRIF